MNKEKKLMENAKTLQREYHKKWQRENADKVKEYNQRYWLKKAAELSENNA